MRLQTRDIPNDKLLDIVKPLIEWKFNGGETMTNELAAERCETLLSDIFKKQVKVWLRRKNVAESQIDENVAETIYGDEIVEVEE